MKNENNIGQQIGKSIAQVNNGKRQVETSHEQRRDGRVVSTMLSFIAGKSASVRRFGAAVGYTTRNTKKILKLNNRYCRVNEMQSYEAKVSKRCRGYFILTKHCLGQASGRTLSPSCVIAVPRSQFAPPQQLYVQPAYQNNSQIASHSCHSFFPFPFSVLPLAPSSTYSC